jgi:hypothetical protein
MHPSMTKRMLVALAAWIGLLLIGHAEGAHEDAQAKQIADRLRPK